MRALFIIALSVLATACQTPAPAPTSPEQNVSCPAIDSRDWSAHINAMPGPGAQRTLIVTGQVDLPTPGYAVSLAAGIADRSAIPMQHLVLTATAPDGIVAQVVTSYEARYEGPAIAEQYRGVRIMCGGEQLAELEVTTAH